ncbi:hypothetical protein [Oenococcus sicerae]|uniref:hypothetical protein n=1 Tax=Oenococcus sicerae TaxID=2203724 RepID=UPI0010B95843|nr:hypothetical protein OAL24_01335 [Oenococcus sicerae]
MISQLTKLSWKSLFKSGFFLIDIVVIVIYIILFLFSMNIGVRMTMENDSRHFGNQQSELDSQITVFNKILRERPDLPKKQQQLYRRSINLANLLSNAIGRQNNYLVKHDQRYLIQTIRVAQQADVLNSSDV